MVEFAIGTRLLQQQSLQQGLPIVRNGPPGTFVVFPAGLHVSLPTDQIVYADDSGRAARVGFGGMAFAGTDARGLVFHRVREMRPEEQLSPARSHTMVLEPDWVREIVVDGVTVWPERPSPDQAAR